jgi:FkbM family methyltransferase
MPARPIPFVLAATHHGTMIVNRNDYRMVDRENGYGVGFQLLSTSSFDREEVSLAVSLLRKRQQYFGDGVTAVDCGANIGVHTIEWARAMTTWGSVYSFEAQEKVFYALAGNVILNNCLNVTARHCAVGAIEGRIRIPTPNYLKASSFGSLELKYRPSNEYIGQDIDYESGSLVDQIPIDSLSLNRLDFIKIDVEGMEADVLRGAFETISRHKPIMIVETIKSDQDELESMVKPIGYAIFRIGINLLGVHSSDPTLGDLQFSR